METFITSFLLLIVNGSLWAQTATTQTNTNATMNTPISNSPLAVELIRVGNEGIETGDNKVLDAYFSDDFVLHNSGGDMNLTQLKAYWAGLRQSLTGFAITREQIITEGNMVAARSTFTGTFDKEFTQPGVGTIKPTGKPVKFEVVSLFRYDDAGRLAEEWVRSDGIGFLKELGVDVLKQRKTEN